MAKLQFAFVLTLLIAPSATVAAQQFMDHKSGRHQESDGRQIDNGLVLGQGTTYLGPIQSNAYGPGINADATGRPFQWQPQGLPSTGPDPTVRVTPNAYGMGVHADQYGRVVQPVCPFGQSHC
jgi:hypothetical protein